MAFDNLVLAKIVQGIDDQLQGAFIDVPYALAANQYALPFHAADRLKERSGGRGVIVLNMDPSNPFISFSDGKFTKAVDNTPFFNSLRRIAGQRFIGAEKVQGERVVTLKFARVKKELGDLDDGSAIVLELFPSRNNAFLLSLPSMNVLSLYKERGDVTSAHFITRNSKYRYPASRRVFDRTVTDLEQARPLLAREVFKRLEARAQAVGFIQARDELLADPGLYFAAGTILPSNFGDSTLRRVQIQDIYSCFVADQKALTRALKEKDLTQRIDKALKTAEKKLRNLKEDYEQSMRRMSYADIGNALFLHQTEWVKNSDHIEIDGQRIALDPRLDIIANANAYFRKYKKAKLAITALKELERTTQDEINYLRKKALEIPRASNRDLLELKAELVMEGYLKDPTRHYKTSKNKAYQPHLLTLADGTRIAFGANGLQNEYLTFKLAHSHDTFVHVKDYPGSHVLILDGRMSDEALRTAAELALWLSGLDSGDVMVAEKRYVKKNPQRIGLVNILEYRTVHLSGIRPASLPLFKKAAQG